MTGEALLSLLIGVALAAACGLRVFVPLLAMSVAARAGHFMPAAGFAWLGSDTALIALAAATVIEVAAYHVPWLDHLLDHAAAPLAVAAGVISVAASAHQLSPFLRWALAVIAGGGGAGLFQGLTSLGRLGSTFATGGIGNPFFATAETAASVVISLAALALPLLAVLAILAVAVFAYRRRRRT
jgi:hypothetical protein